MIKRMGSMLLVVLLTGTLITGCGGAKKAESTQSAPAMDMAAAKSEARQSANFGAKPSEAKAAEQKEAPKTTNADKDKLGGSASAITQSGAAGTSTANAILAQRKIIRNANVTVEVEDFDVSYGKIKTLIEGFGFVTETNIRKEKVYVDGKEKLITKGIVVIRVDRDKFDGVMDGIRGLGLLIEQNIKSDDITDKFFDTESRLRLLRFEENRLEQFLLKQTEPKVIFDTESRLTDIRHEIEGLTGTLKKWNDLVELSTITINMTEKSPLSNIPIAKNNTYWSRLTGGFTDSTKGIAMFFGELLILLISALPVLIVLGFAGWLGFVIYRKVVKSRKAGVSEIKKENDTQM